MKRKILRKGLSIILSLGMFVSAFPASWADSEILGAGAPPSEFSVYINVDGSTEPTLLKKYSASEMRTMAADSKNKYLEDSSYDKMTRNGTIYYTGRTQYAYYSGRAVTEYVLMSEFLKDAGVEFEENDYLIMGPDYTIDPIYRDEYNFGSAQENYERYWYNYGWYDHDDIMSDSRYYFQNWNADTKFRVPSVIALKSYGGDGWMEEGYWEMYAGQSDYLWAYVINFGQENINEATYTRFYRQNTECTIKLGKDDVADGIISDLLAETVREANKELNDTVTGNSAAQVPEDKYWVPEIYKNTLQTAIDDNGSVSGTNEAVYNAYLSLKSALKDFNDARQSGAKIGFTWFSEEDYSETERYTIRTKNQMLELAQLVNGTADLGEHVVASAYDFEGKTIELIEDVALDRNRITIGNADHPFKGIFDGGGHTLSGLKINVNSDYAALFGNNQGTIKNLTLSGDITQTAGDTALAAGIAAYNSGNIENCVSYTDVTASNAQAAGGIAGINTGTILNSVNIGTISNDKICGGIAGQNAGIISGCINTEKIESQSVSDEAFAGGIAGLNDTVSAIENSVNTGDISATCNAAGGIVGLNRSAVSNCYSTGSVEGSSEAGGIAGTDNGSINNCYYLEGSVKSSDGDSAELSAECKTEEEMLSAGFAQLINSGSNKFVACNGNYPRLTWQREYSLLFDTDGGTSIEDQKMGQYFKPLRPDDPQKDNSTFEGWYADEDNVTEYDFSVPITEDRIIYAKWSSGSGDREAAPADRETVPMVHKAVPVVQEALVVQEGALADWQKVPKVRIMIQRIILLLIRVQTEQSALRRTQLMQAIR